MWSVSLVNPRVSLPKPGKMVLPELGHGSYDVSDSIEFRYKWRRCRPFRSIQCSLFDKLILYPSFLASNQPCLSIHDGNAHREASRPYRLWNDESATLLSAVIRLRPLIHCLDLTWRETPVPDEQAFAAMKAALKSGCNFWNGGELYGKPHANSLHLLNRYFTKYPEDADKVVLSIKGAIAPGEMRPDGSEKNIRRSIDECLKILDGKKFLDIFEQARQDPKVPLKESMDTMAQYIKEGKLGGIALSEVTADQIREAAALHPIAAVEVEMSLQTPDILTNGVAATCAELNIPVAAYSPLGRGLLTATITKIGDIDPSDIRHHLPRFAAGNLEKNAQMGNEIQKVAKAKGCTPAQIALAW